MPVASPTSTHCAVIGAGYVGLPSALVLCSYGHRVTLVERDRERRALVEQGRPEQVEDGLEPLLREQLATGRLEIASDAGPAVRGCQFVFLCVATPLGPTGAADLSDVWSAVEQIEPHLEARTIVVIKSTVPLGTARQVAARFSTHDVQVVSNPEFLREGTAIADSLHPDRTVVGSDDEVAARAVAALWEPSPAPVVVTNHETAELIKYAANGFLTVKLSYVNSIATLAETVGADMGVLSHALGLDPRIGPHFLKSGPGWGGPCLPKDAAALVASASVAGRRLPVVEGAIAANDDRRIHVAERIRDLVPRDIPIPRVAVLGLSFKANTSDRRESPAVSIIRRLREAGCHVSAFDPTSSTDDKDLISSGVVIAPSWTEAVRDVDVIAVLTEWRDFGTLDWSVAVPLVRHAVIYDARGIVDQARAQSAGFTINGVTSHSGRSS